MDLRYQRPPESSLKMTGNLYVYLIPSIFEEARVKEGTVCETPKTRLGIPFGEDCEGRAFVAVGFMLTGMYTYNLTLICAALAL